MKRKLMRLISVSLIRHRQLKDKSDKFTKHNYCYLLKGTSKTEDGCEMEVDEINIFQFSSTIM